MKSALPLRRWRIHPQEHPLLKLMTGHFALALLSMTMLQSVHWGLFLDAFGSQFLPLYFLGKGVLLLLVSLVYSVWWCLI